MSLIMMTAAVSAADVQGTIENVQYWNALTQTWQTTAPSNIPFGSIVGAKATMRNTGNSEQIMRMELTLYRPDGSVKAYITSADVLISPNSTYEQSLTDYTNQPGIWKIIIQIYGEEKPMQYVEMYTNEYSLASAGWNVWDISSLVPTGTKVVELYAKSYGNGSSYPLDIGARKYGSSLSRILKPPNGYTWVGISGTICCEVGSDRIIEVYQAVVGADIRYRIIGYII
jgi:hypothetical protein